MAINRLRQTQRRGLHVAIEDTGESALARPPTQEEGLRRRDLLRALEELPEEQRTVAAHRLRRRSILAAAAQVLDVPIGTVMSRLARGREKLRLAFEEEPEAVAARRPNLRRVK